MGFAGDIGLFSVAAKFLQVTMMKKQNTENIISHGQASDNFEQVRSRLKTQEELEILDQLTQFELGQFLLKNRGLNGFYTSYVILHGPKKENLSPLEHWLLHKAPTAKATQERFQIFKQQLQKYLKTGMTLASIPCGLMDDLLRLDYSDAANVRLVGIDLDTESLELAQNNAEMFGIKNVAFLQKDAWNLGAVEEFDVITSNGLNVYEPDDNKIVKLYSQFFEALKPGGILITSFLTPPPWKDYNPEDVLKQKTIFVDVLQVGWQALRTEKQTYEQLKEAGFAVVEVILDSQGMFPTIIAKKQ